MKTYRVVWEIDVEAGSEHDAAQRALEIQRDEDSQAVIFDVTEYDPSFPPVQSPVKTIRIDFLDGSSQEITWRGYPRVLKEAK